MNVVNNIVLIHQQKQQQQHQQLLQHHSRSGGNHLLPLQERTSSTNNNALLLHAVHPMPAGAPSSSSSSTIPQFRSSTLSSSLAPRSSFSSSPSQQHLPHASPKRLPSWIEFLLYCGGVFLFSILAAYTAELTFHEAGDFKIGYFLTLCELGTSALLSSLRKVFLKEKSTASWKDKTVLGCCFVATRSLTNITVDYTDYPTQVIIKSAKVIPVMMMGFVVLKKTYSALEYLCASLLAIGIIIFTLGNSSASPSFQPLGVFLGLLSLVTDALVGNNQERLMNHEGVSESEIIQSMNGCGFVVGFVFSIVSGYFPKAFSFCAEHPHIYVPILLNGVSCYLALNVIAMLVNKFGTVVTVMVTSTRKVFTIVLSYMFFPKPITPAHVVGVLVVVLAIVLEVIIKTRRSRSSHSHSHSHSHSRHHPSTSS